MAELLRFSAPGGGTVVVESGSPAVPGPAAKGGRIRDVAQDLVEEIRQVSTTIGRSFKEIQTEAQPDALRVTFGLKFTAEVGAVVAKSSTEASIVVEISWDSIGDEAPDA
jgi:hypothetical protein